MFALVFHLDIKYLNIFQKTPLKQPLTCLSKFYTKHIITFLLI